MTVVGLAVSAMTTDARAQEPYRGPGCELSGAYFLVDQAETYLKGAYEEEQEADRIEMRASAERTLLEALDRGEVENPAVWYLLGRAYQISGDLAGMDSTFRRAQQLAPECAEDIKYYRELTWVPIINEAIDSLRGGGFEAAKGLLATAAMLRPEDNLSHYYLARIFANDGEVDSAIAHFGMVLDLGPMEEPERQNNYLTSLQSIADLYSGLAEWDSAAAYYNRLRDAGGGDATTLVDLAQAYENAGNHEQAMELYAEVIDAGETMEPSALFETGQALFLQEQFSLAIDAFETGLAKNPYAVPAMYDLANSYRALALSEGAPAADRQAATAGMLETSEKLVAADPLSAEALRLLASAQQLGSNTRATDQTLAKIDRLPVELEVYYAAASGGAYSVQGQFRNVRGREVTVPAITFEFLSAAGDVLETKTAGGETIAASGSTRFSVTATASGIVGYRYTVGS
jgi:tetratricopeptide (TPR) repeat protein